MKKVGFPEKLINWASTKFVFGLIVFATLVISQTPISYDQAPNFQAQTFEVSFSNFSPAFAAFEDDFLFEEMDSVEAIELRPTEEIFDVEKVLPVARVVEVEPRKITTAEPEKISFKDLLDQFDGEKAQSDIRVSALSTATKKTASPTNTALAADTQSADEELSFGSLVAMVKPNHLKPRPRVSGIAKKSNKKPAINNVDEKNIQAKHKGDKPVKTFDRYVVSGGIALRDGLAFIGSMEVSWVVGDYELKRGSINVPDATFEVEVNKLVGDVIISLYDTRDELLGEGLLDLTTVQPNGENIKANIEILPIDWDVAGQIVHADSLGAGVMKPIDGVNVALYSFNDATQTADDGSFSFYNWKKTDSRTLAIASKSGFFDSIFTLDSKTEANVLLFSDSYMKAFFSYIQSLGIYEVSDKGTVYGRIQGVAKLDGYSVKLEKARTIYFDTGLATIDRSATASNGMFSFVGLQDGDYELSVSKNGEVLDERIVVVEQGKVSPILVDLSKVSKHLEFFDPMDPDLEIRDVELSFFDGAQEEILDKDNQTKKLVNRGYDLSLLEYRGSDEINRTLLSRHKGLQKIPLISDSRLLELAARKDLSIENGLAFGFVESKEPYEITLAEENVGKIVYFDENGDFLDDVENKIPHGFILGNFSPGLSSLIVVSPRDNVVLGTDLIYSNHESISVTHLQILPTQ